MCGELPAIEPVAPGAFSPAERSTHEPQHEEDDRHDPQHVNCETHPEKEQNDEECEHEKHETSVPLLEAQQTFHVRKGWRSQWRCQLTAPMSAFNTTAPAEVIALEGRALRSRPPHRPPA